MSTLKNFYQVDTPSVPVVPSYCAPESLSTVWAFSEFDVLRNAGGPSHIFIENMSTHRPAPPSAVPANSKSNANKNRNGFPEFQTRPSRWCDGKQVQTREPSGYVPSSIFKVDPEQPENTIRCVSATNT